MGIFKTQEIRAAGAIDHLIRLPEDDVASRLKTAIVVALVANAAVFTVAFFASVLHKADAPPPLQVEFLEKAFDDLPRVMKLKPVVERPKNIPLIRRRPVLWPKVKPKPLEKTIVVNKPKPLPLSKPVEKPRPRPNAVAEKANEAPVKPNVTAPSPAVSTPRPTNVTSNSDTTARVNTSRAIAAGATPEGPGVTGPLAASDSSPSVSAATERDYAALPTAAPTAPMSASPTASRAGAGVSMGTVGTAASRKSTGVGISGDAVRVDAISTPSFIGRRGPALGSTAIITDRPTILTAAMEESGTANSGLATIQGAKGTVAKSVAISKTVVSGSGSGTASAGAGGRNLSVSDTVSTAVAGAASSGATRGPRLGNSAIAAAVGANRPGAAAEGDGGAGPIGGNDNIGALATASTRAAGGGTGPVGAGSGSARLGGGSGGGNVKATASTSDAKISANPDKVTSDSDRKPITVNTSNIAKSQGAGGSAATRNEDARATFKPDVELSTDLKRRQFKARVLVEVEVSAEGNSTTTLIGGSGDAEVDKAVLSTLRRWKWVPGYRDGKEVTTKQKFEYIIRIN
jgi:TonB family protein